MGSTGRWQCRRGSGCASLGLLGRGADLRSAVVGAASALPVRLVDLHENEVEPAPPHVLDGLETWVAHFEEHLAQLRDEVRPREDLPGI